MNKDSKDSRWPRVSAHTPHIRADILSDQERLRAILQGVERLVSLLEVELPEDILEEEETMDDICQEEN